MVDTKVVTGFGSVAVLVVLHGVEENVKQADQVSRTGHVLRVELNAEKRTKSLNHIRSLSPATFWHSCRVRALPEQRFGVVHDALIGVVVGVGEEDVPVLRQGVGVDGEAVVLTGDEAAVCPFVDARLVVATVTVPERKKHTWRYKL